MSKGPQLDAETESVMKQVMLLTPFTLHQGHQGFRY